MLSREKACLTFAARKTPMKRRWVRNWLMKRSKFSHMKVLNEIRISEPKDVCNYFRMSNSSFNELLNMVFPRIIKQDTVKRPAIPVEGRLAVTLRFLATGRPFECLKFSAYLPMLKVKL
jgi:hypothetical protein